jgi:hypothetical protein
VADNTTNNVADNVADNTTNNVANNTTNNVADNTDKNILYKSKDMKKQEIQSLDSSLGKVLKGSHADEFSDVLENFKFSKDTTKPSTQMPVINVSPVQIVQMGNKSGMNNIKSQMSALKNEINALKKDKNKKKPAAAATEKKKPAAAVATTTEKKKPAAAAVATTTEKKKPAATAVATEKKKPAATAVATEKKKPAATTTEKKKPKEAAKAPKRSFTVVEISKHGGCPTKFNEGRFMSRTPAGAAKKAFNEHCRLKNIRGICALHVTLKETTQGTPDNLFTYKLQRHKLKEPLIRFKGSNKQFLIEYKTKIKSVTIPTTCKNPGKTAGPMKTKTARKTKPSVNNILLTKKNKYKII